MKTKGFLLLFLSGVSLLALTHPLYADEYTNDEIDIDEDWKGASVSAKFGSSQAVHDNDGIIESYSGEIGCHIEGFGDTACANGTLYANVVGSGNGSVKSKTGLYYHTSYGNNLGTGSQSLKPFTIQGTGVLSTAVTLNFDGLMVLKETSVDASDWVSARVDYMGAIQEWNDTTQTRDEVDYFDGMATVTKTGGGSVTVSIPETFTTNDFPDEINQNAWYNNSNLQLKKVVSESPGTGEILVTALPDNGTQGDAVTHLAAGRDVYYLVYSEAIDFDATAGQTYYV